MCSNLSESWLLDDSVCLSAYVHAAASMIVGVAVATGCTAVIPGYGFISESRSFAEACAAKDIDFCGPVRLTA